MRECEREILQELIYERVRASVNLCQLVILEQDLEQCIGRVLAGSDGRAAALARGYIQDAWQRLESDWAELRDGQEL